MICGLGNGAELGQVNFLFNKVFTEVPHRYFIGQCPGGSKTASLTSGSLVGMAGMLGFCGSSNMVGPR